MNDTPSDSRQPQPELPSAGQGELRIEQPSSSARGVVQPSTDEPTIITNRPPVPSPAMSDSTYRILEGRVMPGDRIGHFDLVEYVGGGGMGRVFRAIDTQLGRTVALKILPPEQATDADALQRFHNEAQSSARLDHDNIAQVFFVGEDRGLNYIVFEFVDGLNVRALVERKGPLPLAEAVSYSLQVAEALAHADARSVVHRDIKPSNVLITSEGRVKLIDMGLARLRHADPAVADLTASGVTLGTFDYISPEQARDPRDADIRSDIYSLGCTLFFMLAGQPPFPEGTVLQKLLQHQADEPPDIRQFRPELPEESSRVLRKMMEKDPGRRYATPDELVADLLLLADQLGLRPMAPTSRIWLVPQDPSVSFLRRHLPWITAVAALVLIVAVLDQFWAFPTRQDDRSPQATEVAKITPEPSAASSSANHRRSPVRQSPATDATMPAAGITIQPNVSANTPDEVVSPQIADGRQRDDIVRQPTEATDGFPNGRDKVATPVEDVVPLDVAARADVSPSPLAGATTPASTGESLPPSAITPTHSDPLIVSNAPKGSDQFLTLEAACAAAGDGNVIELRFDGRREERPIKISNLNVTIRAGEGYRPVLVFRPAGADPVEYPRSMLILASGQLTLIGVAVELHVPRAVPAENWSLLETWGGELVRLERCTLTVRNDSDQGSAYHQDVAFFRARSALDADKSLDGVRAATPLATIELNDCIARGEADFLRVEDLQPVHLTWDNGLLITTEGLLAAGGSQVAPKLDEVLRIELRRVTAVTRGGLCRLTNSYSDPYQLTVQFACNNCILMTAPGVPLIEQEGTATVEDFRQRFIWNGDRDFYQDVDVFWLVRNVELDTLPDAMLFEDWKLYWGPSRENEPSVERLVWKWSPNVDQPLHAQGPADYTLEDPTFGDSSAGAPGCQAHRLPQVPVDPVRRRPKQPGRARDAGTSWRMGTG